MRKKIKYHTVGSILKSNITKRSKNDPVTVSP